MMLIVCCDALTSLLDAIVTVWSDTFVQTCAAQQAFDKVEQQWEFRYLGMVDVWRCQREEIIPFLGFPAEICRVIYTTNAIESLNFGGVELLRPTLPRPTHSQLNHNSTMEIVHLYTQQN